MVTGPTSLLAPSSQRVVPANGGWNCMPSASALPEMSPVSVVFWAISHVFAPASAIGIRRVAPALYSPEVSVSVAGPARSQRPRGVESMLSRVAMRPATSSVAGQPCASGAGSQGGNASVRTLPPGAVPPAQLPASLQSAPGPVHV